MPTSTPMRTATPYPVEDIEQVDPFSPLSSGGNNASELANATRGPGLQAQLGALQRYQAEALGQGGPSLADMQLRQQAEQQLSQALAMGSRGSGGNVTGAPMAAMAAQQAGGIQLNAQQAQMRAAEQAQAQAAAAQLGGQLYGQGLSYDQLATQRDLGADQNSLDWYSAKRGMDQQQKQAQKEWTLGLVKAGAGALGGVLGGITQMSDERVKTGIHDGGLAATEAVGELQPKTYQYKPGYGPPGERVGVMAQDLERTPAGAAIVSNMPYGKEVDVGGLASLGIAATAENKHEIDALRAQVQRLSGMLGAYPARM